MQLAWHYDADADFDITAVDYLLPLAFEEWTRAKFPNIKKRYETAVALIILFHPYYRTPTVGQILDRYKVRKQVAGWVRQIKVEEQRSGINMGDLAFLFGTEMIDELGGRAGEIVLNPWTSSHGQAIRGLIKVRNRKNDSWYERLFNSALQWLEQTPVSSSAGPASRQTREAA